jgi:hypothetical protein
VVSIFSLAWAKLPVITIADGTVTDRALKLPDRDLVRLCDTGVFETGPIAADVRACPTASDRSFLDLPLLRQWSISALLVEDDTIFAGLIDRGDRAARSGGLLHYHRRSRRVTVYSVPDPVHSLVRASAGLFIGTTRGAYLLNDGAFSRVRWKRRATQLRARRQQLHVGVRALDVL